MPITETTTTPATSATPARPASVPSSPLAALDAELNGMILEGRIFEAIDRFYAEDVVMRENDAPPTRGKAANVERERAYFGSIEAFHGATLTGSAVGNGVTYSEWTFDQTFKGGARVVRHQATARRWRDGKVVDERFYYAA